MNNSFALEVLLIVVFWRVDFLLMYHSGGHVTDAVSYLRIAYINDGSSTNLERWTGVLSTNHFTSCFSRGVLLIGWHTVIDPLFLENVSIGSTVAYLVGK